MTDLSLSSRRWPARTWLAAGPLALAFVFAPAVAQAAEPPVVQLASCEKGCDALAARLRGELEALGFEVRAPADAERADKRRPEAVIQLQAEPLGVQIWTRASMRMRTYSVDPTDVSGDVDVLARRAAEVVRAETTIAQTPLAGPAGEPAEVPPPAQAPPRTVPSSFERPLPPPLQPEEPAPTLWIHLAPALTVSSGPIAALAQADVGLRFDPVPMLRAEIFGTFPLAPATAEEGRAEVSLFTGLVGGSLGLVLGDVRALSGSLAAGVAWQWLRVDGFAEPPLSGTSETAHVSFTFAQAEIAYAVHPDVHLVGGARLGVSAPEPVLAIAGQPLGGFGRPASTLMIGVSLPITISASSSSVSRHKAVREPGRRETAMALAEETSQ